MKDPGFGAVGRYIWVSLFGRWIFFLLVPWFVPVMSYLLIGEPYLSGWEYFVKGTLMVLLMTVIAFVPHDLAVQYITRKLPSIHLSLKRAILTVVVFYLLTVVFVSVYGFLIMRFRPLNANLDPDKMITVYIFEFFAVLLLTCLYEVKYSLEQWKEIKMNKEALKKAGLQGRLQGLKSQVNPHFLFNSLNVLSALITEDTEKAERFVDEMADVYRYMLQTNQHELTTVATELNFIRSYYHLLSTRYDEGLNLVLEVNQEDMSRLIPSLTLQLLVENAVKHNAILDTSPLDITIRSFGDGWLEVKNNMQNKSTPVKSTRLGLANIRAKYQLLSDRQPVIDTGPAFFSVLLPLLDEKPGKK